MTETVEGAAPVQQSARWPGRLLLIAALIELLQGLAALPILAGDLNEVPGPGLGGAIIIATIVLHPLAALAALYFIVRAKAEWALVSMAVVILANWVSYLPSIRLHGLDLGADGTGGVLTILFVLVVLILPPILVLAVSGWRSRAGSSRSRRCSRYCRRCSSSLR